MTPRQLSKHATTYNAQWLSSIVIDHYFANYIAGLMDTILLSTTS